MNLLQKNILIWGMGSGAQKLITILSENDIYKIVGVTDSNVNVTSNEIFCKIPVLSHSDWGKVKNCDYAIICAYGYEEELRPKINSLLQNNAKVLNIKEFELVSSEDEHKKLLENNALYNFFYTQKHRHISKWFHYFEIYDSFFSKFRGKEITFCEIGINKGGSLQMWKNYFGNRATIIGIDINKKCKEYEEDQIYIEIGSQDDISFWNNFKLKYPKIDILLDDGGHTMNQQIVTFEQMFRHISDNGLYLCEDTHTSYWNDMFEGGYKKNNTFIEYPKNWIDDIHAYHLLDARNTTENVLENISMYNMWNMFGIHYYDSMVVIEKRKRICYPFSISQ